MAILDKLHAGGHTIILVTHEDDIADHAERIIFLRDGLIESDVRKHDQHGHGMSHADRPAS